MELEITQMSLKDLEEIKPFLLEDFDDFWTPSVLKQELENKQNLNSHYFVVRQNSPNTFLASSATNVKNTHSAKLANNTSSTIVGFAGILTILDEVNIMNIVVKKDKRNLKIGSSLLEYIIHFAKKSNATSITLEVNEHNSAAISLYKKFHFIQVGIRKKYYNQTDDAILMTLLL